MNFDSDKTVKIIVTVKNRAIVFPTYLDLNALRQDEFHAELILGEYSFADKEVFASLVKETAADFLPAGSRLLVNISLKETIDNAELKKHIITDEKPRPIASGGFIEIYLHQDLKIKLRGGKKSQLLDCEVFIPALGKIAKSINHAYTLVSEKFEPWRTSHTANVFNKVFCFVENGNHWAELDDLRAKAELK